MVRKRRHHYVWQYYLSAWAVDGVVACLRDGNVFETGTTNVAVRKDFYRLKDLSDAEIGFVRKICLENSAPFLQALNEGWFSVFLGPFALQGLADALKTDSPEIGQALAKAVSDTEEDLQAAVEAQGIPHLESLRAGDTSFLGSQKARGEFLHYLSVQYFRTPKIRDDVIDALGLLPEVRLDHVWGLMSHIFATNVAHGLLNRWETTRVTLFTAPAGAEFITADQPVINTYAVRTELFEPVERIALYYPVSPTLALYWDVEAGAHGIEARTLTPDEVDKLNRDLLSMVQEQAFATNRALLESLTGG